MNYSSNALDSLGPEATKPAQADKGALPLNLQPGDWVQVQTAIEIMATLDLEGNHFVRAATITISGKSGYVAVRVGPVLIIHR